MHRLSLFIVLASLLTGCSLFGRQPAAPTTAGKPAERTADRRAHDVVMFALALVDTGYRFGGKNPDAGLDCSGMVSYVFDQAANIRLKGSAAELAQQGRPVDVSNLRPGDLLFFNTRSQPHSHVGIYIGNGRFVHAPSSNSRVRTESLTQGWFATRFEGGRTLFD